MPLDLVIRNARMADDAAAGIDIGIAGGCIFTRELARLHRPS